MGKRGGDRTNQQDSPNKQPIRVAHVIARMNIGGPAVLVTQLLNELDQDEFETVLITGYCEHNEAEYAPLSTSTINVQRVPSLGRGIKALGDVKALIDTRKALKKFRPDIVHTHTAKAGALGRAAAFSLRPRPKIVHTFHGHVLSGYFSPRITALIARLEAGLAKLTNRIVTVGDSIRDDLLEAGIGKPEQYVTIAPEVTITDIPNQRSAREHLGLDPNAPVIGFVGRLTGIKRPLLFVETAKNLHEQDPTVQFLIVGDGELRNELETFAQDNQLPVTFTGWLEDPRPAYAAMDLLMLTSANEGRPLTVLEALFLGKRVVSTNVGSLSEIEDDNLTLVPVAIDAPKLADVSLNLIDQRTDRKPKPGNSQSLGTTKQHESLYKSLADNTLNSAQGQ